MCGIRAIRQLHAPGFTSVSKVMFEVLAGRETKFGTTNPKSEWAMPEISSRPKEDCCAAQQQILTGVSLDGDNTPRQL